MSIALPVSNADVGATAAKIMGLTQKPKGKLIGRVMTEAMPNGATPQAYAGTVKSKPSANGLRTVLNFQRVGTQRYFDAAGFPGRTLGLEAEKANRKRRGSANSQFSPLPLTREVDALGSAIAHQSAAVGGNSVHELQHPLCGSTPTPPSPASGRGDEH